MREPPAVASSVYHTCVTCMSEVLHVYVSPIESLMSALISPYSCQVSINISPILILNITYIRCCYIHSSTSSQQGLYYIIMTFLTCNIQWSCIGLVRREGTKASQIHVHTRREKQFETLVLQKMSGVSTPHTIYLL